MKPDEFLVLATRLSAHSGEADKRSAVSRAYYALFHTARLLIEACDVACPESAEAHDKISKCLRNSQDQSLMAAGDKLSTYRTTRNQADYRLGDPRFTDARFIAFQLAVAREVFDVLQVAANQASAGRTAIREYARDVLKLRVRGED
jgi:hypothetical protein